MAESIRPLIIITAPSGSGKSSVVNYLLQQMPQLAFSVSACTRLPRAGEQEGISYYFISREAFEKLIQADAFAEYEMVYEGKYYGTLKSELEKIWQKQQVPLIDIDVQGALRLKQQYGHAALTIFIRPPDLHILEQRLWKRGSETAASLAERVKKAGYEMGFASRFDQQVVNDNLNTACQEVQGHIDVFLKTLA